MRAAIAILAVLAAASAHAGAVLQGVNAKGVYVPGQTEPYGGIVDCYPDAIYYPLDETGENDRLDIAGCGADCTLTATAGMSHGTGVRGNAAKATAGPEVLTCSRTTCDELNLTGSFTIAAYVMAPTVTFFPPATFQNDLGGKGLLFDTEIAGGVPATNLTMLGVKATVPVASASLYSFVVASWNEDTDQMRVCASNEETPWTCDTQSATGPLEASTLDPRVCIALESEMHCDELVILPEAVSESEACAICACFADGDDCDVDSGHWANTGLLGSICNGCPMPTPATADGCGN